MQKKENGIYRTALYIRLSKEDGDKQESNSIKNQRELIYAYVKNKPEIQICAEHVDDGYSGITFQRPGMVQLLKEVRAGEIDCIIVKDLSRFGRNYIETGKYIQQIFPFLGVRFIAINDNYDSHDQERQTDAILLPFKNLINDFYCRDISVKVRSQIEVRQKRGDYIGSFPVFGYSKDQEHKGRLTIDENAAAVVRQIFQMKLEGRNHKGIANYLNAHGVLPPARYKTLQGLSYTTPFGWKPEAEWSPVAVERILKNELYIGTMVQGKEKSLSYKVKKRVQISKENWIRVEHTHEPIVSKEEFDLVQKLLLCDTRTSPKEEYVYLFAGLLYCGDCGGSMTRRKVRASGKEYNYYICSEHKKNKQYCSSHRLREDYLKEAILNILQTHEKLFCSLEQLRSEWGKPLRNQEAHRSQEQLKEQREELRSIQKWKNMLYEDYKEGLLSKKDYMEMKETYDQTEDKKEAAVRLLEQELETLLQKNRSCHQETETLMKAGTVTELTRRLLIFVVDKLYVLEGGRVRIHFRYQKEEM